VGDIRHESPLVGVNLSVQLVKRKVTSEGEIFDEVVPVKRENCDISMIFPPNACSPTVRVRPKGHLLLT